MPAPVLVLDDRMLKGLAYNAAVVKLAPFVARMAKARGCGPCAARRGVETDANKVKKMLAALPPDKLAELKAVLNVKTVRISFRGPSGQVETRIL